MHASRPRPGLSRLVPVAACPGCAKDLPAGSELPSIRQLTAELAISEITIKRAYLKLEREGVIVTRQGKRSVVAEHPGLQSSIQEGELEGHLQQSVELGLLMGISKTEMQRRIAEFCERQRQGK